MAETTMKERLEMELEGGPGVDTSGLSDDELQRRFVICDDYELLYLHVCLGELGTNS